MTRKVHSEKETWSEDLKKSEGMSHEGIREGRAAHAKKQVQRPRVGAYPTHSLQKQGKGQGDLMRGSDEVRKVM